MKSTMLSNLLAVTLAMVGAASLLPTGAAAGDFVVFNAQTGVAPPPLVLYNGAPPKTREAAVELADYIEKISGTRPELIEKTPQLHPERAIWIG